MGEVVTEDKSPETMLAELEKQLGLPHQGMFYVLDEFNAPVEVPSVLEWAQRMATIDKRRVAEDIIGRCNVSTVFLGINHQWGSGPPLLFETMIFGGLVDQELQWRYPTWDTAIAGHQEACRLARYWQTWQGATAIVLNKIGSKISWKIWGYKIRIKRWWSRK